MNAYLYLKAGSNSAEITRDLKPGGFVSLTFRNADGTSLAFDLEVGGSEDSPQLLLQVTEPGKSIRTVYAEGLSHKDGKYIRRG